MRVDREYVIHLELKIMTTPIRLKINPRHNTVNTKFKPSCTIPINIPNDEVKIPVQVKIFAF